MAFGIATVITNIGKAMFIDRVRQTPATYTNGPRYMAIGTGATGAARTAAVTDTALTTERLRVAGTESVVTTTTTNDTYQNVASFSITANWTVDEVGLFDANAAGNMFLSATTTGIPYQTGDSVTMTVKVQLV